MRDAPTATEGTATEPHQQDPREVAREQASLRAERAERSLAAVEQIAHVGSWELEVASDRVLGSDELARIFGRRPDELATTGEELLASFHADDRQRLRQLLALIASCGGTAELDVRVLLPDGGVRVVHTGMGSLERPGPDGVVVVGACRDVTEQRAAEAHLQSASSLLEATLESTADGLLVVNRKGCIVKHNAKFASLWRLPTELIETRDDASLISFVEDQTVDPRAFREAIRELYRDLDRDGYDEILLKDGRTLERYSQAQRVDGKPVGRVWSFRDVTEKRRAEAARDQLLLSERVARQTAQAAATRAALLAEAIRLLASLDHASALVSLARLVTGSFADQCAIDVIQRDDTLSRIALAPDAADADAFPCDRPPGETTVSERAERSLLGVPLAVAGRLIGTMRFARSRQRGFDAADLTLAEDLAARAALAGEIAQLYRQKEDALRTRDEFLAMASHELRAPLASLQTATDGLLAGVYGEGASITPSQLDRPLRVIQRQVRRLARLAADLLDASTLPTTGVELHAASEDLSALVTRVVERLRVDLGSKLGDVVLDAPGPVIASVDRQRIDQVVTTLLSNAVRYGVGRPIEVRVRREGDRALLSVRDQGVGIASDRLPTLFTRFDRAGASRDYGGLGLGLYVAQAIIVAHGGVIHVESQPGEGTMFLVDIPLVQPPEPP